MAALVGLAVSAGPCGRSMLGDCGFNARAGELNSAPAWVRKTWNGHGVGVGVGVVRGGALGAYGRGTAGRGPPAHVHARDRVVDFGKNKGSMLGTLSSRYLRWMTKNLKGTMLDEWAGYAQETLDDPLYLDRIEWEKVEKLLVQSHDLAQLSGSRDALAPARMYGWDLDNEFAWSKVNFALLGTTNGGKIPRVPIVKEPKPKPPKSEPKKPKPANSTRILQGDSEWASTPVVEGGSLRDELDRRRQARRERLTAQRQALLAGSKDMKETKLNNKFPGRGDILNKLQENNPRQVQRDYS